MTFSPAFNRVFSPTFDRRNAGGNGLLNNLIAYWPLNEAGGANDALDLHTNGLTLTQTDSPGSDTGKVYSTARVMSSQDKFTRASESLVQIGDNDATIAVWVYLTSLSAESSIFAKYTSTGNQREFVIEYNSSANKFQFLASGNGTANTTLSAATFGAPSLNTWYFIVCNHNSVANTIGISINNGTIDTTAYTTGIYAGTSVLQISGINNSGATIPMVGRVGPIALWRSAGGSGGILTAAQITALYNAGSGLAYAGFTT